MTGGQKCVLSIGGGGRAGLLGKGGGRRGGQEARRRRRTIPPPPYPPILPVEAGWKKGKERGGAEASGPKAHPFDKRAKSDVTLEDDQGASPGGGQLFDGEKNVVDRLGYALGRTDTEPVLTAEARERASNFRLEEDDDCQSNVGDDEREHQPQRLE